MRGFEIQTTSNTHVLAIGPLLTADLEIPGVGSLEEGLVLGILEVELLELVRLPIGGDRDGGLDLLPAGDEDAADGGVVALAKDTHGTEEILARLLETVEESADEVRRHVRLCQFVVVLVVNTPEGEALLVKAEIMLDRMAVEER